ncbi:Rha family transcriptional regulator [Clostridium butyricum]|nr:Rha family transcriptional regulator [Clostridium butyricum]
MDKKFLEVSEIKDRSKQEPKRLSSREVAEMMEVEHSKLLRKIDGINEDFVKAQIGFYKYWNEGEYINPVNNKPCREFQISKKGC